MSAPSDGDTENQERRVLRVVAVLKESMCGECDKELATVTCRDCKENYCEDCLSAVHKRGRRTLHTNFVMINLCSKCEECHAQKECLDCRKFYCDPCSSEVHSAGKAKTHRYIKPVGTHLDVVDLNVKNGFGIAVAELSLDRWRASPGGFPEYMRHIAEVNQAIGSLLRETTEHFVDPEPITLDAAELMRQPRVTTSVLSADAEALEERRLRDFEAVLREKHKHLQARLEAEPMGRVHCWRRSFLVMPYPTLFGEGNDANTYRPPSLGTPPYLVEYAPCFETSLFDDSYFLLALLQVASHREAFKHLFVSCDFQDVGMYTMQFYRTPDPLHPPTETGWQCVTVDDLVPCNGEMKPIMGTTKDPNEMWAMLIEKAYAKFLGSFTLLQGGDHVRAMGHLTGGVTFTYTWDPAHIDTDSQSVLWWRLKENTHHGLFSSVMRRKKQAPLAHIPREDSFDDGDEEVPPAPPPKSYLLGHLTRMDTRASTLTPEEIDMKAKYGSGSHYAGDFQTGLVRAESTEGFSWDDTAARVVFVAEVPAKQANEMMRGTEHTVRFMEPLKLVKLQNVHGRFDWSGDWSNTSKLWNKELRTYFGATRVDDFTTWMKIEDFVRQYDTICITQNFPGAPWVYYNLLEGVDAEGMTPLGAHQFFLRVNDPSNQDDDSLQLVVNIRLSQPDKDSIYQNYRDGADMPEAMEALLFRSDAHRLQECYNDNEGEYETVTPEDEDDYHRPQKVPKPPYYLWPQQNMVQMKQFVTPSQFVTQRQVRLTAGYYVLVVQQSYFRDTINYCVSITADDPLQTGFTLAVENLGTLTAPRIKV